jgi:hypothetical protein
LSGVDAEVPGLHEYKDEFIRVSSLHFLFSMNSFFTFFFQFFCAFKAVYRLKVVALPNRHVAIIFEDTLKAQESEARFVEEDDDEN